MGFSFKGETRDYLKVLLGKKSPSFAPIQRATLQVPNRPGAFHQMSKTDIRQISIPVLISANSKEELQLVKEDLAAWLITDEPQELILDTEPNRIYYAYISDQLELNELMERGTGTITFICPDPYKYGLEQRQTISVPPATFNRDSVAYNNDGSQVAIDQPRYEVVGKNLVPSFYDWNLDAITTVKCAYEMEATTTSSPTVMADVIIGVEYGKTYTISGSITQNSRLRISKTDGTFITHFLGTDASFTIPQDVDEIKLEFRNQNVNATPFAGTFTLKDIQLEEGSTATAFEPINYGILIEEGTTNLFGVNGIVIDTNSDGVADSFSSSSKGNNTVTFSVVNSEQIIDITDVDTSTFTFSWSRINRTISSFDASKPLSVSCDGFLESNLNAKLTLGVVFFGDSGLISELGKDFTNTSKQRLAHENLTIPSGTTSFVVYFAVFTTGGGKVAKGHCSNLQLEQKPYATSFINGTRQPETLTIPSDVFNPEEGTIEFEMDVNDTSKRQTGGAGIRLIQVTQANNSGNALLVYHQGAAANWQVYFDNGGVIKTMNASDSLTPNGLHVFSVTWKNGEVKFYIDSVLVNSLSNVSIASTFGKMFLGSYIDGTLQPNTYFSNLRLSKIARTDAEILDTYNNGFTVDEHTTAFFGAQDSNHQKSLAIQNQSVVENIGTAESYPVFKATFLEDASFFALSNGEKTLQVGEPISVDDVSVPIWERVLYDELSTTTGWAVATGLTTGVTGTMVSSGSTFKASDFGSGPSIWHGPALKKSLPSPLKDFQVNASVFLRTNLQGEMGKIDIYLLDVNSEIIARMTIRDAWRMIKAGVVDFHLKNSSEGEYIYTSVENKQLYDNFNGTLRIKRKGNEWAIYVARVDSNGKHSSIKRAYFTDFQGKYSANIAQVAIHITQYDSTPVPSNELAVGSIEVYKINQINDGETPSLFLDGDVLEIDTSIPMVYLNGAEFMEYYQPVSDPVPLLPGENMLAAIPENSTTTEVIYRPRWK